MDDFLTIQGDELDRFSQSLEYCGHFEPKISPIVQSLKIPPTVLPKIGKTRTKILANLYESFQKSFHPRIPLTLLCDPFYNRALPR